jgi:hypothetical protein
MDNLTPHEVFMKFYFNRKYWENPNNRLYYTGMKGFGDKIFVIEKIWNDKFIVTDCDELTEKESIRYKIILEQMDIVERKRQIQSDLDHLQYSQSFVKLLGLDV